MTLCQDDRDKHAAFVQFDMSSIPVTVWTTTRLM
jgi:hypothetical protein